MPGNPLKSHFSRFLGALPQRLHFAAHSHHPWPDVSFDAHQQAWLDAARLADQKWGPVFDEVVPRARSAVARVLNLPDPATIAFAPSTHELFMRAVSAIDHQPVLRILTTDSEFHSFARQAARLEEAGLAQVTRIATQPWADFPARFKAAAATGKWDLVYFSQCFYNSGFRVEDPVALVNAVADPQAMIIVDGYHAYMAIPTDWSSVAGRAFYTAGGYKYAMTGEGACFMHCPPGWAERPLNTGWFSSFGALSSAQGGPVPYAVDGMRLMGSTYDPTPLYRLNAVMDWLAREGITVGDIRERVLGLQDRFLRHWQESDFLRDAERVPPAGIPHGNFLVLRHPRAGDWHQALLGRGIGTDYRNDRLRIGFGLYQDETDVDAFFERVKGLRC